MGLRTYSELSRLKTFEERFEYLSLNGVVGSDTFGHERHLNQTFYTSHEWRSVRRHVIARDYGCDLGMNGYDIYDQIIIHHMNPIRIEDIKNRNMDILNPMYLISTRHSTHNAIHYGDARLIAKPYEPRRPGDTKLW